MNRLLRVLNALAGLAMAVAAHAAPLDIGHLAPGAGPIDVTLNGEVLADGLVYREFRRIDLTGNRASVQIRRRADGAVLFDDHFALRREGFGAPLVLLFGNGQDTPYTAMIHLDGFGLLSPTGSQAALARPFVAPPMRYRVTAFNLAPAVAALPNGPRSSASCIRVRGPGSNVQIGDEVFGGYGKATSYPLLGDAVVDLDRPEVRFSEQQCRWRVLGDQPRIELETPPRLMQGFANLFLLIGDERSEPLEIIAVVDAQVVARSTAAAPSNEQSAARSRHLWVDPARLGQSVSLFELGAGGLTYGTWQTFAADGRPAWYLIEGVSSALPGRRDLILRRSHRVDGTLRADEVGSSVLLYLDCNNAELRAVFDGGGSHTLRLRRTREVDSCGILQ